MEDIIELLHAIGRLKDIKRTGWVMRQVPNPESVADHSFRTSIMALLLAEKMGLDRDRCIRMALIHDVAESLVGDITPHQGVSEAEKHRREKEAMNQLFEKIDSKELVEIWHEYEERESPEAKFVYELDKLEMLLQAFEYEKKYKDEDINLEEFWTCASTKIKDSRMINVLEALKIKRNI